MATLEPAQFTVYGIPVEDSNVTSEEFRQLLEALARNFYSTDPAAPLDNRDGQARVLADDPANIKFQVYLAGAYRTVVQNIQTGIAAPIKQVVQVPGTAPLTSWVIDHNLGSQVQVQVFDTTWQQLRVFDPLEAKEDGLRMFGMPDLTVPAGVGPLVTGFPVFYDGVFLSTFAVVTEAITGTPDFQISFDIDKTPSGGALTPVNGGIIAINAAAPVGTVIPGTNVIGTNDFRRTRLDGAGLNTPDLLDARISTFVTGAAGGAIEVWAQVAHTVGRGEYIMNQPTTDRVVITHPNPRAGFAVLVG